MKIRPLLEHAFPKIKERNVRRLPNNYLDDIYKKAPHPKVMGDPNVHHLGSGSFASAYTHKDNPHDIWKSSRHMSADGHDIDGFYYYLKALESFKGNTNPYFPRFRNIRINKRGNKMQYTVQVEKLFPLSSLYEDEAKALLRRMYIHPALDDTIVGAINDAVFKPKLIKDEQLLEAGRFIRRVMKKYKLDDDMHLENIMVRRTPYGAQLVITDPLGYRSDFRLSRGAPDKEHVDAVKTDSTYERAQRQNDRLSELKGADDRLA